MAKSANAELGTLEYPGTLQRDLPGAAAALNEPTMLGHVQRYLLDSAGSYDARDCRLTAALLDDDRLLARYEIDLVDAQGRHGAAMVTGRVYPDVERAASYVTQRLARWVPAVAGRAETAPFARPVAVVEELAMVLQAYPLDGELPTLAAATDPTAAGLALAHLLGAEPSGRADGGLHAVPVHYNRRHRCMLRYLVELADDRRLVLYGKVTDDDSGNRIRTALDELRKPLAATGVCVPECLGVVEDLRLTVFTEIAGAPLVAELVKAYLRGDPSADHPTVEEAVSTCGRIAATLHTSGLAIGPARTLGAEISRLRDHLGPMRRLSPTVAQQLGGYLDRAAESAAESPELPLCQSHGDFSYTQLLFDGEHAGVVDFDNLCQAEPSLDLGQFIAYLRYAGIKSTTSTSGGAGELTDRLVQQFTDAYVRSGGPAAALQRLRTYEVTNLVRMAQHAWENLKRPRLRQVMTLLAERDADPR